MSDRLREQFCAHPGSSSAGEIWPIGAHCAVFAPATRAVALVNDSAAAIWRMYASLPDLDAVSAAATAEWGLSASDARSIVSGLVDGWSKAGLIGQAAAPAAAPDGTTARAAIAVGVYSTLAGRFSLSCEDPYAAIVMAAVLAPLAARPGSDARVTHLDLHGTTDLYWTARNGIRLCEPGNISQARHEILRQLLIDPTRPEQSTAILHAAAVRIAGRAVVIAGDCGRGKSTLTACLVHRGADYLGDDLIPVERNGSYVGACPVALSVKIGSWAVVRPLHPSPLWSKEITINRFRLKYIHLGHLTPVETRIPAGAVVFPHYIAGAAFKAEQVPPEQSLQMLVASGSRTAGELHTLEGLCRLADQTPAWKLTYGEWRDAARFLEGHLTGSSK